MAIPAGPPRTARNDSWRRTRGILLSLAAVALTAGAALAQAPTAKVEPANNSSAAAVELGRYASKDGLVFYVECDGLKLREGEWKATAAYKMLNTTSLGVMLEEVAAQTLDKFLAPFPGVNLTGQEIVTLIEHAAQEGFVIALNIETKPQIIARSTFVLRGGAAKEFRPISSKWMKGLMGEDKPKMEWKSSRGLVLVAKEGATNAAEQGWVWWAEKNDLVIARPASTADRVIATLDGQAPSVVDHPQCVSLFKREGSFQPVLIAFMDLNSQAPAGSEMAAFLQKAGETGLKAIDYRLGFDGDALQWVARVTASKSALNAGASDATFDKNSLIPTADGVTSFLEFTIKPDDFLKGMIAGDKSGTVKKWMDDLTETIQAGSKIDLERDLLANLGPRMVVYLAPGKSAAASDESSSTSGAQGLDLAGLVAGLQSYFPKVTFVAEMKNPEAVGKAIDSLMIAVNGELKAQAMEKAREEKEASEANKPGGGGGRGAGGGGGGTRKRSASTTSPHFVVAPSTDMKSKKYVLQTPSSSPLKLGPSGFRPTILLEGKYLVVSTASDAVQAASTAILKKDWKPGETIASTLARSPDGLSMLAVDDGRDTLPVYLASFPGNLQSMINTALTIAKTRKEEQLAAAKPDAAGAGGGAARAGGGPAGEGGGRRGRMGPGAGGSQPGGPGFGGSPPGGSRPGGPGFGGPPGGGSRPGGPGFGGPPGANGASSSSGDELLVLKIDAERLPKSEELRALLFPGLLTINTQGEEVRITGRVAFPNPTTPATSAALTYLLPSLAQIYSEIAAAAAAKAAAQEAAQASQQPGQPQQGAPGFGPQGGGSAPGAGAVPAAPPGGGGGRRRGPG